MLLTIKPNYNIKKNDYNNMNIICVIIKKMSNVKKQEDNMSSTNTLIIDFSKKQPNESIDTKEQKKPKEKKIKKIKPPTWSSIVSSGLVKTDDSLQKKLDVDEKKTQNLKLTCQEISAKKVETQNLLKNNDVDEWGYKYEYDSGDGCYSDNDFNELEKQYGDNDDNDNDEWYDYDDDSCNVVVDPLKVHGHLYSRTSATSSNYDTSNMVKLTNFKRNS